MRILGRSRLVPLLAGGLALAGGCTAKVEEKGKLPNVNVEDGALPKVEVKPARVKVTTDTQEVVTPSVHVLPDTAPR